MSTKRSARRHPAREPAWKFRLYVAGLTPRSLAAFINLKRVCEQHLAGRYRIEVVDLRDEPAAAADDQVVAVPTVVRTSPAPVRRVIGDLSDVARVVQGLEIVAQTAAWPIRGRRSPERAGENGG